MADPRYYESLGPLSLQDIAALSGAAISHSGGVASAITVAPLDGAGPGVVAYADKVDFLAGLKDGALEGAVLLVKEDSASHAARLGAAALVSDAPRAAFAKAAAALFRRREFGSAAIHPEADIASDARIAAGVFIGEGAVIESGVVIEPGAAIGPGVRIGEGSRIGAHASLICADIGPRASILAGAVIGEAGFGVAISPDGTVDVPHLGSVELGADVTVGACTAIDRGVFGPTMIGDGCRFDNHCHIAHNVSVGPHTVMAAFAGVSGSTKIGSGVVFGGRVGVTDHVEIGDRAQIAGNAAVMTSVPAGEAWGGAPAQPLKAFFREVAALRRLGRGGKKRSK